eukprot:2887222-Amphidinium_carterae.1
MNGLRTKACVLDKRFYNDKQVASRLHERVLLGRILKWVVLRMDSSGYQTAYLEKSGTNMGGYLNTKRLVLQHQALL